MSFGFSVGDFLAAIELANKIRKEFVHAPDDFKAISDEVRSLSIVLQDVDITFSNQELNDDQKRDLEDIDKGCKNVLEELENMLERNTELGSESENVGWRIKRGWKRLKWKPQDIESLRSRISTNVGLLNAFNNSLNGRLILDNVEKLVQHQENREDQAILDWLTPADYATQHIDLIGRRQAGTGQSLLESAEFQRWLEISQQTLFCPGIPGAGKTILTATVINDLIKRFQNDSGIGIAYLYCNYQRKSEQKPQDLLANLLKQLTQKLTFFPGEVKSLYDKHRHSHSRPSLEETSKLLQSVASLFSRVIIIVDALDECEVSDGCRKTFLTEIFDLQITTRANIFATSRLIPDITERFQGSITCEIRAHDDDVRRYLDGRILQSGQKILETHREEIKTEITKAVDGMFLLAQFQFEAISTKKTLKKMRQVLKALPTGLKAYEYVYDEAWKRIKGQDADSEDLAKQVLLWITCSKRQLTTSELQHALAVEPDTNELDEDNLPQIEDIVSVCAGLVTIDEQSDIVRLVHYTTQEYFDRRKTTLFPEAESEITKTCVTYLSFKDFESGCCRTDDEFKKRLESHKLYHYASKNWGHHARMTSINITEINSFLKCKAQVESSVQALTFEKALAWNRGHSHYFTKGMTELHLAAYFGLIATVQSLLDNGADLNSRTFDEQTPLLFASANGHFEVVQRLLERGADVNSTSKYAESSPLLTAAEKGYFEIIQLLLENGAEVNSNDSRGRTPLYLASLGEYIDIVELLLKKGANVNIEPPPLHQAAWEGNLKIAELLTEYGADINLKDWKGDTPLCEAASQGHLEMVQFLLDHGADKDLAGHLSERTPLYWSSSGGQIDIVHLLLEKGVDVEVRDTWGQTPLSAAAENGHIQVVEKLIDQGADIETKNSKGRTPLSLAAWEGKIEVVKMLLEKGADFESKDSRGRTPLHQVVAQGRAEVVRLLLEEGADIEAKDVDGKTPLLLAVEEKDDAIIMLLIENGADVNTEDIRGWTAIRLAELNGTEGIEEMLRENGAV